MSPKERYLDNSNRQLLAYYSVKKLTDKGVEVSTDMLLRLSKELKIDFADPLWGAMNSGDHKTANLLCGPTLSLIEEGIGDLTNGEERRVRETQMEYFRNLRNSN